MSKQRDIPERLVELIQQSRCTVKTKQNYKKTQQKKTTTTYY